MHKRIGTALVASALLAGAGAARANQGAYTGSSSMGNPSQPNTPASGMMPPDGVGESGAQVGQLPPEGARDAASMQPLKPIAEDDAIAPIFGVSATWIGHQPENAMAPGSPAATTRGRAICERIVDGLDYSCEITDVSDAPNAQPFHGHMLVSYDRGAKIYRATLLSNMATGPELLSGPLTGNKLVLEAMNDANVSGQRLRERFSFDMSDRSAVKWTLEHKLPGRDWTLFESGIFKPGGTARQARTPTGP